jgi:hypothetical protein
MRRSARIAAVATFFALVAAGLLLEPDSRELTPTSFGVIPAGYGAAYDLLAELQLPVARSFADPRTLAPGRTVWWVEPIQTCVAPAVPAGPTGQAEAGAPTPWSGAPLAAWVAGGGTAVVFLPSDPSLCAAGSTLAGIALPARRGPGAPAPAAATGASDDTGDGAPARATDTGGAATGGAPPVGSKSPPARPTDLSGPALRRTRHLLLPDPLTFEDAGAWRVGATLDGRPFLLAHPIGKGRLVAVADPRFLQNRWLDSGDAAPLALDLAAAYGVPWFDEGQHGFTATPGVVAYLVTSPALPFLAGVLLLAGLFAWHGAAEPPRSVTERDLAAPTLASYVDSLAGLYARTRDRRRVLERYRELTFRRLRRHYGLPPDASPASLLERLARRRDLPPAELALLAGEASAHSAPAVEQAAETLDALVARVTG